VPFGRAAGFCAAPLQLARAKIQSSAQTVADERTSVLRRPARMKSRALPARRVNCLLAHAPRETRTPTGETPHKALNLDARAHVVSEGVQNVRL
jgi:hypothetical protein